MIYKFRDPLFSNKIYKVKKWLIDTYIYDAMEEALFSLKDLDFIKNVEYNNDIITNRRQTNIQFTYAEHIGVRIIYLNKAGSELNYDIEISIPKFDITSSEFVINGVQRQPLWQIIDHFSNSDKSIHLVCSCISVHLTKESGYIGVSDKRTHIGNVFSYVHSLKEFVETLGYTLVNTKDKGELLSDVIEVKSKVKNNQYEHWMETFLSQKVKDVKFLPDSKEYWHDMCQSTKFKVFNIADYLEFIYTADIFTRKTLKYSSIVDELFYRYIQHDYDKDRYNLMNKQLYLVQWILSPLISEILNFLSDSKSYKANKKRIIDIASHISAKMSELNHLGEHNGINCVHGLSESLKMSYSGPQGFEPKNVPAELKDLQPSYYKSVDPIHTPDRKQTGVINWLTIKSIFFDNIYKEDI